MQEMVGIACKSTVDLLATLAVKEPLHRLERAANGRNACTDGVGDHSKTGKATAFVTHLLIDVESRNERTALQVGIKQAAGDQSIVLIGRKLATIATDGEHRTPQSFVVAIGLDTDNVAVGDQLTQRLLYRADRQPGQSGKGGQGLMAQARTVATAIQNSPQTAGGEAEGSVLDESVGHFNF